MRIDVDFKKKYDALRDKESIGKFKKKAKVFAIDVFKPPNIEIIMNFIKLQPLNSCSRK